MAQSPHPQPQQLSRRRGSVPADDDANQLGWHWPAMPEVERAMGIKNTALETIIVRNQSFMNSPERCVRLSCEKWCYTKQPKPAPANAAGI